VLSVRAPVMGVVVQSGASSGSCPLCPEHHTSEGGASECSKCDAGTEHPQALMLGTEVSSTAYKCVACTGKDVSVSGDSCSPCDAGYVANELHTACVACPAVSDCELFLPTRLDPHRECGFAFRALAKLRGFVTSVKAATLPPTPLHLAPPVCLDITALLVTKRAPRAQLARTRMQTRPQVVTPVDLGNGVAKLRQVATRVRPRA
jgi:hypothetical protein